MSNSKLKNLLAEAKYIIALTGAGVSTLSGIRDFRGKHGLYQDFDADKIFDLDYFFQQPEYYYQQTKEFIYGLENFKPSLVHITLARLEKQNILKRVITQNIDLLHTKAGSREVIELHGSPEPHYCVACQKKYAFAEIIPIVQSGLVPRCADCGGLLKPNIVFFGEALHEDSIRAADAEIERADLMLVLGSSLVVQPAGRYPLKLVNKGGKIIIVNDTATPLDSFAEMKFDDLAEFVKLLKNCFHV
jgi:NAD-dependent deacetylase